MNPTKLIQVRPAQANDTEGVIAVINAAFRKAESFFIDGDRVTAESMQSLTQKGKFLIAEDQGQIVGCVYVELRGERAYLGLLSVDPQRQGAGLGSTLMNAAEDFCKKAGCRFMDLRIVNLRTENDALYRRRGYVETGTSPFPAELRTKLPCHFVHMSKRLQ